ncbi:AraC family transcriptional regulator [Nostoc sp.]|uniref:AraC family transcriptional regulator n=1 Tax=Nostoc sp. TaxID=1180 RepID=UPI002FF66E0E
MGTESIQQLQEQQLQQNSVAKTELEQSLFQLQAILESIDCGIIIYKFSREITYFNQEFANMWQIPNHIKSSKDFNTTLNFCSNQLKDPKVLRNCFHEVNRQSDVDINYILKMKDGRIFAHRIKCLYFDRQINGKLWIIQDITEHPQLLATRLGKQNTYSQQFLIQSDEFTALSYSEITKFTIPSSIFPTYPQVKEIFEFIENNYQKYLCLDDVAQVVGYSPSYVTQLVKRLTGKTLYNWIVERRMAEACHLLLRTNQTVNQIANTVGYKNTSHFFSQFRQIHNTTPHKWRKVYQSQYNFATQKEILTE